LSGRDDRKGEEVYWRVNLKELKRLGEKRCGFSEPREAPADVIGTEGQQPSKFDERVNDAA